jgi:hypothetical protein
VLLDRQLQDGGQPLRLREEALELLGSFLLAGRVERLPVGGLLDLSIQPSRRARLGSMCWSSSRLPFNRAINRCNLPTLLSFAMVLLPLWA